MVRASNRARTSANTLTRMLAIMTSLSGFRIGGVEIGPGVSFGGGVQLGGLDMAAMAGRDLEVEYDAGVIIIKGHY